MPAGFAIPPVVEKTKLIRTATSTTTNAVVTGTEVAVAGELVLEVDPSATSGVRKDHAGSAVGGKTCSGSGLGFGGRIGSGADGNFGEMILVFVMGDSVLQTPRGTAPRNCLEPLRRAGRFRI